jgi:RNA polymerase sigma factor (sigma-70 family)
VTGAGDRDSPAPVESTIELIHRVRTGDRGAYERLAARFLTPLRRWAAGRLPRRARGLLDTDDLVQDTLLKTVQKLNVLEPRKAGGFQSYLRQAVINRIRDELRRVEHRPGTAEPDAESASPGPSPLQEALSREALARYDAALERLRPEDREAVLARVEMGFDYKEIANAIGKPSPDAARMAINRALVRLAEELAREP